jgi:hypothetical protein
LRQVKCRVTGELGDPYDFYRAPNGKYYKSKEIYDKIKINSQYKKEVCSLINDKILHTNIYKHIGVIKHLINNLETDPKVIYDLLVKNMEQLIKLFENSSKSTESKIFIIFSYISRSLKRITYAGCYEIRNTETNEVYIGESINLFNRFTKHISELYANKHHCVKL